MPKDNECGPTNNHRTPGASQSRSQSHPQQHQSFWNTERAQTSIDLLLAVTIFFSAVALLTITSPDLFFPEGISATDDTTEADRIAIELTQSNLTEPGVTGLTHENVRKFVQSPQPINEQFALPAGTNVTVRISTNETSNPPRALDPSEYPSDVTDKTTYHYVQRGESAGALQNQVTRETTLNNKPVTITVTVWKE